MTKVFIGCALGLVLSLSACNFDAPASPSSVANKTILDEKLGRTATLGYTAASKLGAALVKGGIIDKVAFKAADQKGYDAVLAIKAAYDTGNANSYAAAVANANAAVADIKALVK
jgi:hypothetical protein